ncbi:dihydrofolate reductase [Luteimonas gilva]|uniref:Dihydrofolate reductase n=1 Tax=Luteimonas gilva TaxID=2572684 RepID=A0A4U5JP55_9GAMM|nr:dihydrofolate reductase family protein [Luteimonas gilva]TKR31075.1 dihydrofolate reductase [Luteimonas gilva]
MRKIIVGAFVSMDGVMQAPGGPHEDPTGGFEHGGWTLAYWDEAVAAFMDESLQPEFDLLLGRKTYDIFAAYWPYVQADPGQGSFDAVNAEAAKRFNRITKYVATHRPESLSWANTQSLGSDIVAALRTLKRQDGPNLLVQGSSELVQVLLENDLVDECRLLTYPLALGTGKRLFGSGTQPSAFKLTQSAVSPSGVLMAAYERAGDIEIGSFDLLEHPTEAEFERRKHL